MQAIVKALIYLPQHISATSILAQQARAHIENRGYRYLGFVNTWPDALTLLRARLAGIVVVTRPDDIPADHNWPVEIAERPPWAIPATDPRVRNGQIWVSQRAISADANRCPEATTRDLSEEGPTVAILERWRAMKNQPPAEAAEHETVSWSKSRVQEIIDSSGPIPSGLDQESVAAARRIAQSLARHRKR